MIVSYIPIPCFTVIPVIIKLQAVLPFEKFLCNSSLSGLPRADNKTHLPPEISGKGNFADMSFNHHLDNLCCFKGKIKAFFDNTLNLPWQI